MRAFDDAVQFGQYRVGAARIDAGGIVEQLDAGGMVAVDFDIGIGGLDEEAPTADVQAVRLVARVLGMHAEAGENLADGGEEGTGRAVDAIDIEQGMAHSRPRE